MARLSRAPIKPASKKLPQTQVFFTHKEKVKKLMKTIDLLLARFGGEPVIPLEIAANYWNFKPDTLKQKIDDGEIRIAYFSLDESSQKARKFILLVDLATLIENKYAAATAKFQDQWAELDAV